MTIPKYKEFRLDPSAHINFLEVKEFHHSFRQKSPRFDPSAEEYEKLQGRVAKAEHPKIVGCDFLPVPGRHRNPWNPPPCARVKPFNI